MNCKDSTERVIACLNDGTFDPAAGCRFPRDVIAAYTGLSEKTVSRATKQLEADGRLRVLRPRRRGECNVYFVAIWSPPLRNRTIARLKKTKPVVLRLRGAKCPPKGTTASRRVRTAAASTETRALPPRCFSGEPAALVAHARGQHSAGPADRFAQ